MPTTPIEERLSLLHAHYAWRINAAVAADRMDLVEDLAGAYEDEALALMLDEGDAERGTQHGGPVEIMEFDGWSRWLDRKSGSWSSWLRRHRRH
jgi:hypothetical protein